MACDRFSAQQAYEWGFVNHVYDDDQLAAETRKLAARLLSMDAGFIAHTTPSATVRCSAKNAAT